MNLLTKISRLFFILTAIALFASGAFAADVYLSLSAVSSRSDIALEAFTPADASPESVRNAKVIKEIVENDLILSRFFNLILGNVPKNLTFEEQMSFWEKRGALVLIRGTVVVIDNNLMIDVKMHDVESGEVIWKQSYNSPVLSFRRTAHKISNEIIKRFTGEEGIASSKIVFVNNSTKNKEIYIADYDGFNVKKLTNDRKINILPRFNPSGTGFIFTSYLYNNPDLYFLDLKNNKRSVVSRFQGLNTAGTFSPDGKNIALTLSRGRFPNLYLIDLKGSIIRRMTDGSYIDTSPSFSPNGNEIVFISDRPGYPQLYIMNFSGGNVRRLTTSGYCDSPAWSPRGDKIAFTMRQPKNNYDLYVYDLPTAKITKLTNAQGNNENPVWSPDGRFLAFSSTRSGKSEIYIMAIDGSGVRKLANLSGASQMPSWSVNTDY